MPPSFLQKLRAAAQDSFNAVRRHGATTPGAEDLALLDKAAWGQDIPTVQRLITQWPQLVNHAGQGGLTPLHCAAAVIGDTHLTWLLERGANISAQDAHGNTPLHYAALAPFGEAAEILIKAKADINARNHNGETPLHYAVMHERAGSLHALIAAGAKDDMPRHDGATPRSLAKREDHGHPVGIPPGIVPANMLFPLDEAQDIRKKAFENARILQRDLNLHPGPRFIRKRAMPKNGD